jgi:cytochrome P450
MNGSAGDVLDYDPIQFYEDPYPIYRQLRDDAPVYHNRARGVWVLSRYEDVQTAARDWGTLVNGRGVDVFVEDFSHGPGDFLDMDPPRHDQLRHILRHDFAPKRIKSLEPFIRDRVIELIEPLLEQGGGDLAKQFAQRLPLTMIAELWGVPRADHHLLEDWFVRMVGRVPGQLEMPEDVGVAAEEMKEYVTAALRERRNAPREDLLSTIAQAVEDGRMEEDEVDGMTRIVLIAGIHTTSTLIANSLLLLASLPDERRALASEPERIPGAIEELLRYESPVQWLGRAAESDFALHDAVIPAGDRLILLWGSANRDERKFENPDVLDLERSPVYHMAFGQGIHHCIGAPLARMESRVAFEEFFTRIPDYEIAGPLTRLFTRQEQRGIASLPARLETGSRS